MFNYLQGRSRDEVRGEPEEGRGEQHRTDHPPAEHCPVRPGEQHLPTLLRNGHGEYTGQLHSSDFLLFLYLFIIIYQRPTQ